ncbi:NANO3 protein, partial [Pterocles burchelli]|nr:NANO3 protein [Pterocles burchelli]
PVPAFDMWRDYLGLAAVVAALPACREDTGDKDTSEGETTAAPPPGAWDSPGTQGSAALCAFCKHNGEARQVYAGHRLRDARGRVQCPVLRSYVCPQCGATRDRAHTKRFCPLTRRGYASVYSPAPRNGTGRRAAG